MIEDEDEETVNLKEKKEAIDKEKKSLELFNQFIIYDTQTLNKNLRKHFKSEDSKNKKKYNLIKNSTAFYKRNSRKIWITFVICITFLIITIIMLFLSPKLLALISNMNIEILILINSLIPEFLLIFDYIINHSVQLIEFLLPIIIGPIVLSSISLLTLIYYYIKNRNLMSSIVFYSKDEKPSKLKKFWRKLLKISKNIDFFNRINSNNYSKLVKYNDGLEKIKIICSGIRNTFNHFNISIPPYFKLEDEALKIPSSRPYNIINKLLRKIAEIKEIAVNNLFFLYYEYNGEYHKIRGSFDIIKKDEEQIEKLALFLLENNIIPAKEFDLDVQFVIKILQNIDFFNLKEIIKFCYISQEYYNNNKEYKKFLQENGFDVKEDISLNDLFEIQQILGIQALKGGETSQMIMFIESISKRYFQKHLLDETQENISKITVFFYFLNRNKFISQICRMIASNRENCKFLFYYICNEEFKGKRLSDLIIIYEKNTEFQSKIEKEYKNDFELFYKELINGVWTPNQFTLWSYQSKKNEKAVSKKFESFEKNYEFYQSSKRLIFNKLSMTTFFKILRLNDYIPFQILFKSTSGCDLAPKIDSLNPDEEKNKLNLEEESKKKELFKLNYKITKRYYNSTRLGIIKGEDFIKFKSLFGEIIKCYIEKCKEQAGEKEVLAGCRIQEGDIYPTKHEEIGQIDTYKEIVDLLPEDIKPANILSIGKLQKPHLEFKDFFEYFNLYDMMENRFKAIYNNEIEFLKNEALTNKILEEFNCKNSLHLIHMFDFNNKNALFQNYTDKCLGIFQKEENFQKLDKEKGLKLLESLINSIFSLNNAIKLFF
ncbi:MAG: hypothetical protein ACTSR3_07760 [Candidatus Helarchaeota archaeon]